FGAGFCFLVGRIGENDSEWLASLRGMKKREDILFPNVAFQFRSSQVVFDGGDRGGIFFHEQCGAGAAAERFDPQRAAACEEIENARADDFLAETGKNRGLHAIHRGTHAGLRGIEPDAARYAGDHSHGDAVGVGDPTGAAADSSASFFFFAFSDFDPPMKLLMTLLKSFRSRPISLSI